MLEFSIFVPKESHESFGNIKARGNLTGMSIPENQNSTFYLILQTLFNSAKISIIMHNLGGCLVACFYCKAGQHDSLDALKNNIENEETNKKYSFKGILIISNI